MNNDKDSIYIYNLRYSNLVEAYTTPPDTIHFTLGKFHLDEIPSDHTDRDRRLYTYCRQNIHGCELVLEAAHYHTVSVSQYCKFMYVDLQFDQRLHNYTKHNNYE